MLNCPCCPPEDVNDLDNTFGAELANKDAKKYLKKGLSKRGRKLIAHLAQLTEPVSVLDIGCGAGAVHHELLRQGIAESVVGVDASSAYLNAAGENAKALGLTERASYFRRDFAQFADEFEAADVVIMDRVVCCYPHLEQLLGQAAQRTGRFLAISLPLDGWWIRPIFAGIDWVLTLFKSKYHPYLHPHLEVLAIANAAGLAPVHVDRSGIWRIFVFGRREIKRSRCSNRIPTQ